MPTSSLNKADWTEIVGTSTDRRSVLVVLENIAPARIQVASSKPAEDSGAGFTLTEDDKQRTFTLEVGERLYGRSIGRVSSTVSTDVSAAGLAVVSMSQAAYDALPVKDSNTLYVIPE